MKDLITQIEKFLFDIIGIVVPGFTMTLFIYWIFKEYIDVLFDSSSINLYKEHSATFMAIGIILLYIIGTVVKVLAIIQYSLFIVLLKPIKEIINYINKYLKDLQSRKYKRYICDWLIQLIMSITNIIERVVTFDAPSYSSSFDDMKKECEANMKMNIGITKDMNWYSLYKLCTIIIREESLVSLSERFLAKYNFYRSMSFVFLCIVTYFIFWGNQTCHRGLIIIIFGIFWYSFHYKFKRYWVLCGDDTMLSVLYFFKKQK